ncbi:DUF4403 family protein [Sphingomonas sp. S2-65]|uniref:DUF4403 family protein n=1 Tax=Sphingomonas sp. S2-65 TaxID=2903960 RepID=UPI001F46AE62|nr:DUF4403 family protein [Sphingomonas sp. S2-65]UYY57912.1 DUF4403 family protein [Sphingomonas sp. S2-65]
MASAHPLTRRFFQRRRLWIIGIASAILLAGIALILVIGSHKVQQPPRVTDPIAPPRQFSAIAVPLDVNTAVVSQALEREIPRTLWSIDRAVPDCVPPARVKLLGAKIKVTPEIGCTIVGTVTRAPIRLRGRGEEIIADVPIHAQISARDVGGVLKGETATGSAMAHARIRLRLMEDWSVRATVRLAYDWTDAPGIDFLGRRITFTDQADARLQPIVRELERTLPREIAKLNIRARVADAWGQSFTSLQLNKNNPPVWMRITPQRLSYGGYSMAGSTLRLRLGMQAMTETFVGPRPQDSPATPLPPLTRESGGERLRFFIPVTADYAQLEPVILRALVKRARRPFHVPGIGAVAARFEKVTGYATKGGRIALGIALAARRQGEEQGTRGVVWVTARPVNAENSQRVGFSELAVDGDTDGVGGDLLVRLINTPGVSRVVADSLTQNFTKDFQELLAKVERAIVEKRAGDFVIRADIGQVRTGVLKVGGQGLYLPVWADGSARVTYVPGAPRTPGQRK